MRTFADGATVWVQNDEGAGHATPYSLGRVHDSKATAGSVNVTMIDGKQAGRKVSKPAGAVDLANSSAVISTEADKERSEPDNCNLLELSEATLLHNTVLRFNADEIYTFTGQIVTSVNPCKPLPHLYSVERMQLARERESVRERRPHIFSVGETAFASMHEQQRSQSIVVTGVSGAGKTEANKYLLRFLCWRAAVAAGRASAADADKLPDQAKVVLRSTPVFESFGNATTVNNSNSSRFGKFTKLFFDEAGVAGATISTYLLEKSRLAVQQAGEANFHIFYQLLAGLDDETLSGLHLSRKPSAFAYLNTPKAPDRTDLNDPDEFGVTDTAMTQLRLRPREVYRLLAGLLHLGNVTFETRRAADPERASRVTAKSAESLKLAEGLLGIERLEHALTTHLVQAGGGRSSFYEVPQTPEEAARSRDAFSKRLYERLFNWLVKTMNKAISGQNEGTPQATGAGGGASNCSSQPASQPASTGSSPLRGPSNISSGLWIGLLDVFGFEVFAVNSLEQLLINLANEKLQRFFLDAIFRHEQALYAAEEIEWVHVSVPDNEAIMAAIESKPHGLLSILDEQCRLGERGSDEALCLQLNQKNSLCVAHVAQLDQKRRAAFDIHTHFSLNHFVAPVEYTAANFLEKNRDTLYMELGLALASSSEPLLQLLFPASEKDPSSLRIKGSGKSYATVSSLFVESLSSLLRELAATDAGFIRCIKPNQQLAPGVCDQWLVLQQLRSCGMLQAVKMIRSMFPSRIEYTGIAERLQAPLSDGYVEKLSPKEFVTALCGAFDVDPHEYRLGKTKIFFKAGDAVVVNKLCRSDLTGDDGICDAAVLRVKLRQWRRERHVVSCVRRWANRARLALHRTARSETISVADVHAYRAPRRAYAVWLVRTRAATRVQKHLRSRRCRVVYATQLAAAVTMQRRARGGVAARAYAKVRANATSIQAAQRRAAARRSLQRAVEAAVLLQTAQRRHDAHQRYLRKLAATRLIQMQWRQHRYFRTATVIESAARRMIARRRFVFWITRGRPALVRLQALARGRGPAARLRMFKAAARSVQATWRMVRIIRLHRALVAATMVLQVGMYALKFPKKAGTAAHTPHWRYLWLAPDMKQICYAKVHDERHAAELAKRKRAKVPEELRAVPTDAPTKIIPMKDVSAISDGTKTEMLKRMERRQERTSTIAGPFGNKSLELHEDCCFSIISASRNLDLMAESRSARDTFMVALQTILVHGNTIDTAKELTHGYRMRRDTNVPDFVASGSSGLFSRIQGLSTQVGGLNDARSAAMAELSALKEKSRSGTPPARASHKKEQRKSRTKR